MKRLIATEEFRHGDVQVQRLNDADELDVSTMSEVPRRERGIVLADGEVTGHAHAIREKGVRLYDPKSAVDPTMRILRIVKRPASLDHEEHLPIDLKPGLYRTGIKRQYSEDEDGWESVRD